MNQHTAPEKAVRRLSLPELAVLASVLIGRMDETWVDDPSVSVDLSYVSGDPRIGLNIREEAGHDRTAAWISEVARAMGDEVGPTSLYGIASVYQDNWEGTGVTVCALARVARPHKEG